MASLEHVDLLRHVPPFDGLGERHLHAIGDVCTTVTLAPGTVLTRRGATPDALHVILRGQARIVDDAVPGMPVVIDDVGRGGHAGEAAIDAGPAPFSVTCVTEVDALALGASALRALRGQWPDIDTALRDHAARRDDARDAGDGGGDPDAPGGAGSAGAGDAEARRESASGRREPQAPRPIGDGPVAWQAGATVPGRRPRRLPLMRQRYASDAGPACLATVARHYGRRVGLNAARERAGSGRSPGALPALERAAQGLGFETRAGLASYDQLARAPLPAIAGWSGGHWVVVSAIEGSRVTIGDPAAGTRRVAADAFQAGWTGEMLYLGPTARLLELPARGQTGARAVAYFVPMRRVLGELMLASVLVQVLALTVPVFARFVIDDVIARQDRSWLWPALAGMGAALALSALAAFARRRLLEFVSRQFDTRLADDVYRHLLALPARFFEGRHAGETVRHFEETSTVTSFLAGTGAGFLIDMGTAALAVALMVHYDARLAALAVLVVALEVGQLFVAARRLGQGVTGTFRTEVDREGLLLESFSGLSTIKALAIEHFTRWKLEGRLIAQINASFDTLRYRALAILGSQTLGHLGPVAVLFTGALLVLRGELTAGVLVAVVLLARMVSAPFSALVASWGALQDTAAAFDEIADILDTTPESPGSPADRVELQQLHGHVRFEGVSFRYDDDGPDTLHDVTFECYGGQRIAIVGPSGSGKTTLLKLLLGFYQPTAGVVRVDGFDLSQIWLPSFRRQTGIVLQDPRLFRGSLRSNISQTAPAAALADIVEAARMANAHLFISRLPHGYETRLEENGSNLSGGQRQQVAIARAFLHRPRMLVLDEATSNLDEESARAVRQSLDLHCPDATVFMITQRLAGVRHADLVLVLDAGRLVECGPPDELLAQQGLFARMAMAQDASHR